MSELLELKPGSEMNLINSESVWNNISKHNRVLMMPVKEDCFIYKVEGVSIKNAKHINSIENIADNNDWISVIEKMGGKVAFYDVGNEIFKYNLIMLDSKMPKMLGNFMMYACSENISRCKDIISIMGKYDPLGYGEEEIYVYKFKEFLSFCLAAGKETENFYVAIKTDGKIITSHPYKRDMFEKSLFENAILKIIYDGGRDFIRIDEKSGDMFICLNMQLELI